ncbi:hypothetical protein [Phenylobacterium sp.]|uniref:hypothetical protein n=1 Tax=Phenylobacterium sp. TaxID=1871053 RepID=UPI002737BF01|nr:hypothetical protein [Phenylobacterium sp.]MDP3869939.1 hypothetical protein [Phenylobacterium sp.]
MAAYNRKETLSAVRALDMVATYDPEAREYRVTYLASEMPDTREREKVAHYTTDGEDAVLTAAVMMSARRLGHV